jgi:hypothetical protein
MEDVALLKGEDSLQVERRDGLVSEDTIGEVLLKNVRGNGVEDDFFNKVFFERRISPGADLGIDRIRSVLHEKLGDVVLLGGVIVTLSGRIVTLGD